MRQHEQVVAPQHGTQRRDDLAVERLALDPLGEVEQRVRAPHVIGDRGDRLDDRRQLLRRQLLELDHVALGQRLAAPLARLLEGPAVERGQQHIQRHKALVRVGGAQRSIEHLRRLPCLRLEQSQQQLWRQRERERPLLGGGQRTRDLAQQVRRPLTVRHRPLVGVERRLPRMLDVRAVERPARVGEQLRPAPVGALDELEQFVQLARIAQVHGEVTRGVAVPVRAEVRGGHTMRAHEVELVGLGQEVAERLVHDPPGAVVLAQEAAPRPQRAPLDLARRVPGHLLEPSRRDGLARDRQQFDHRALERVPRAVGGGRDRLPHLRVVLVETARKRVQARRGRRGVEQVAEDVCDVHEVALAGGEQPLGEHGRGDVELAERRAHTALFGT